MSRLFKLLTSLKLTVSLIFVLVFICLVGVLVPQKVILGKDAYLAWRQAYPFLVRSLEFLHFTDIFSAPVTLGLWALFFLNLALVMMERIPRNWKRCNQYPFPRGVDSVLAMKCHALIPIDKAEEFVLVGRALGFKGKWEGDAFCGVKNRFAPLATLLFHCSFFLIMIGGVLSFYTKFRAEADIAAGETFEGRYTKILRRPRLGAVPTTQFVIESIEPTYFRKNTTTGLKVVVNGHDGRGEYSVNRPYRDGKLSFVIVDIDMAPYFVLEDTAGTRLEDAAFKLKVLAGKTDGFRMSGYDFKADFYTDEQDILTQGHAEKRNLPQALLQAPQQQEREQNREIVAPAFAIGVYKNGVLVKQGIVKRGAPLLFDGKKLVLADLGYWTHLYVGKEYGLEILYAGFALLIAGIAMRFGWYRRTIVGIRTEDGFYVGGSAELLPELFCDDFNRLVEKTVGFRQLPVESAAEGSK